VTPEEMAREARDAFEEGASVMHVHVRQQGVGKGHLPSWEPTLFAEVCEAIREACPGVLINMSTGVLGPDISAQLACLNSARPELAACNAGTLNYLKTRADGAWAWPPMVFDNPVNKVKAMCEATLAIGAVPEFECFDLGILRSVSLFVHNGWAPPRPEVNLVMGVASGMPADPRLLELCLDYLPEGATWQSTVIGREEVWALHERTAQLGGHLRTGLEDTFYLPNGSKASGNGVLIRALAQVARRAGREPASPDQARALLGLA
jgi:uncharacterized protein (DUF849 family)